MQSTQADTERTILRYLAGKLTGSESAAFERAVSERPALRDEIERLLKLREGLVGLRERGELDVLLRQAMPPARRLAYAAAAALVCLGAALWFSLSRPTPALLALSPAEFAAGGHQPAPVLGTYLLARMRGSAAVTDVPRAGIVGLRLLPSAQSPATRYGVRVGYLDGPRAGRTAGQSDAGPVAADGYVTVYLDTPRLTPGTYEVSLSPRAAAAEQVEADRFTIRLR